MLQFKKYILFYFLSTIISASEIFYEEEKETKKINNENNSGLITAIIPALHQTEGRKEMFYLTAHSTHFTYGYMASDMVKDHSDSVRENPLPPHGLLFPINSKGSFICTIPQTG